MVAARAAARPLTGGCADPAFPLCGWRRQQASTARGMSRDSRGSHLQVWSLSLAKSFQKNRKSDNIPNIQDTAPCHVQHHVRRYRRIGNNTFSTA